MKRIVIILLLSLGLASCQDWLDINRNPNTPTEVSADMVLPQAQLSLAVAYGGMLHNQGSFFIQYFEQGVGATNFAAYTKFDMAPTNSDRPYREIYAGSLNNAEYVRTLCAEEQEWGTYLAATVIKAFDFQVIADYIGEAPYSEALKGSTIAQPKYDNGPDIYNGIIGEIDAALAKVTDKSTTTNKDLLFKGNTAKWVQFANSLKLKIYMRQALVNADGVKEKVMELIKQGNFIDEDVKFTCWADEATKRNPWYEDAGAFLSKNDHMASMSIIESFKSTNDPRLDKAYDVPKTSIVHRGGVAGYSYDAVANGKTTFSTPKFDAVAPVYLYTVAELKLWIAEAEYRWGSKDAAKSAYEEAIGASFVQWGVSEKAEDFFGPQKVYAWVEADGLKQIAIQKWMALACINGFESWCEVRRTGYPEFCLVLGGEIQQDNALYVSNTIISPVGTKIGDFKMMNRMFYPDYSVSRNPNAPAQKTIITKVFWQK